MNGTTTSVKPVRTAVTCAVLLAVHALLKEALSRYDIMSCIFAAGGHVPVWMLICALTFVAVRLMAFLLIPAIVGWAVATFVVGRIGLLVSRRQAS